MILQALFAAILTLSPIQSQAANNGYEDYVRAAAMLQSGDFGLLIGWSPRSYAALAETKKQTTAGEWTSDDEAQLAVAKKLSDAGALAVQRRLVEEYGRVIDVVKVGNGKPIWVPTEEPGADVLTELAGFKSVAKLFRADAYCRFADGDSKDATNDLLAGYTFAMRIGGSSIISELVSIACRSIILADFDEHLSRLSDVDALTIIRYVDATLAEPDSFARALARERDLSIARTTSMFDQRSPVGGVAKESLDDFIARMTPAERESSKAELRRSMSEAWSKVLTAFGKGESSWAGSKVEDELPAAPQEVKTVEDLAATVIQTLAPEFEQATIAELKARAQLRLLGLHARIIDFQWKNNHLPQDLKEAVPEKLIYDPMGNESFHFEILGAGYKLYSIGVKRTGPIELRYRRQPGQAVGGDGIPPRQRFG